METWKKFSHRLLVRRGGLLSSVVGKNQAHFTAEEAEEERWFVMVFLEMARDTVGVGVVERLRGLGRRERIGLSWRDAW